MMGLEDPPDLSPSDLIRYHLIVEWWTEIERSGDSGRTTWEVLDRLRDRVTALLESRPRRLDEAEQTIADALWQITGFGEKD